jgi:hypothetical protein
MADATRSPGARSEASSAFSPPARLVATSPPKGEGVEETDAQVRFHHCHAIIIASLVFICLLGAEPPLHGLWRR